MEVSTDQQLDRKLRNVKTTSTKHPTLNDNEIGPNIQLHCLWKTGTVHKIFILLYKFIIHAFKYCRYWLRFLGVIMQKAICCPFRAEAFRRRGFSAAVYRSDKHLVVNALDLQMLTSLKTFYGQPADDAVTDAWDKMQEQFHCCGIDETQKSNFIIWRTSKWHMDQPEKLKKLVPASCCVKLNGQYVDINACQMFDPDSKVNTTAIYTEGCYRRFEKHLFQISSIEGTLGILASLFLIKPSFFCALLARLTQNSCR
ncbi:Antigen -like protein [Trichinella sp. T8]|nr:Antigen -like protein [Trichinella sp. T8]